MSARLCLLFLAGILPLLPSPLVAQATPVSEVIEIPSWPSPEGEPYFLYSPTAIPLAKGGFALGLGGWAFVEQDWWDRYSACGALLLGPQGEIGELYELDDGRGLRDWEPWPPSLAPRPDGGFRAVWSVSSYGAIPLFLDGEAIVPDVEGICTAWPQIAANPAGRFAVTWLEDDCRWDRWERPGALVLQVFNAAGRPGPQIRLELQASYRETGHPQIGIDRNGRIVVIWREGTTLRGQRFSREGLSLGPRMILAEAVAGESGFLGMTAAGSFLVAWNTFSPLLGWETRLQWWSSGGRPEVPGLEIPGSPLVALASDHHGNLALLRKSDSDELLLDLLNRDLVRQGTTISVGTSPDDHSGLNNALALSDTGRLLTVWSFGYRARVWQARHEADACVWRDGTFLCDTANDGDTAEKQIALTDGLTAPLPFLADWNGDGRADPCVFGNGRFGCDTAHNGGYAEDWSPPISTAGDKPLLGDLNGDGKADPCVRRGAAVLCDLARDGGSKDLRIVFGTDGDKVLLGDPNGDGKDDPCLLRAGHLLCDTAHNGGLAELRLDLRPLAAQGTTLFGDVNGDGRDEACRFTGERFVCGVYPVSGGVPVERIEIVFGKPGDIPLLGDLDAF